MHLNGWQRLWVVISAIWTVSVVLFVTSYLPESTVYQPEVFERMSPDTGEAFVDYPYRRDKPVDSFKPLKGATVDIGGQMVDFADGISKSAMDRAAADYYVNLRAVRNQKRVHFAAVFAAVTAVMTVLPAVALYVLGWSVAWVRRGFSG